MDPKNSFTLIAPENWSDITLKQYRLLLDAQSRWDLTDPVEQLEFRVEQVHILNPDIPVETIKKMTLPQLKDYFSQIDLLFDKEPVKEEVKEVQIDGKTYRLIDFKHLSLEGWIDGEKYSKVIDAHKLIAIFYLDPATYNDVELDKVSDWFDSQPATKSFYLISQFFFTQKVLEIGINLYSEKMKEEREKIEKMIQRSKKITKWFGGISFMTSRIMTFLKLRKSSK